MKRIVEYNLWGPDGIERQSVVNIFSDFFDDISIHPSTISIRSITGSDSAHIRRFRNIPLTKDINNNPHKEILIEFPIKKDLGVTQVFYCLCK